MFSRAMSKGVVLILGSVIIFSLFIGIQNAVAMKECNIFGCSDDCEFTSYFRLEDCEFAHRGTNPFFILQPGYRLVLVTHEGAEDLEKSVETVLCDTKWINLYGRMIKTRVLEERALEWDDEEGEWVTIEISRNYFAICKRTNAVYYFGEWSRDCPEGFDENDECTGIESNEGSWEAGVDGAWPGLIMPGTPLMGAKYFQEIAPPDAVDRGEIVDVGFNVGEWSGCIEINDTNPAEGVCKHGEDVKIYCPGIGLVQDEDLELIENYFIPCNDGE